MKIAFIITGLLPLSLFLILMLSCTVDCMRMSKKDYHIIVRGGGYTKTYNMATGGILTILRCAANFTLLRIYTAIELLKIKML